jgi:hypothetical protein
MCFSQLLLVRSNKCTLDISIYKTHLPLVISLVDPPNPVFNVEEVFFVDGNVRV